MLLFFSVFKAIFTTEIVYFLRADVSEQSVHLALPPLDKNWDYTNFIFFHRNRFSSTFKLVRHDKYLVLFNEKEDLFSEMDITRYKLQITKKEYYSLAILSAPGVSVQLVEFDESFSRETKIISVYKTEHFRMKFHFYSLKESKFINLIKKIRTNNHSEDFSVFVSSAFCADSEKKESRTSVTTAVAHTKSSKKVGFKEEVQIVVIEEIREEEIERPQSVEIEEVEAIKETKITEKEKQEQNEELTDKKETEKIEEKEEQEKNEELTDEEETEQIEKEIDCSKNKKKVLLLSIVFGLLAFTLSFVIMFIFLLSKK